MHLVADCGYCDVDLSPISALRFVKCLFPHFYVPGVESRTLFTVDVFALEGETTPLSGDWGQKVF